MNYYYLIILICYLGLQNVTAQKAVRPDASVLHLSYFGIGSESVQKPSVIGYQASSYALFQRVQPDKRNIPTYKQAFGIPVSFYQELLKSPEVAAAIKALKKENYQVASKATKLALSNVRQAILGAQLSKSLVAQVYKAIDEELGKKAAVQLTLSPTYTLPISQALMVSKSTRETIISDLKVLYASFWGEQYFYHRVQLLKAPFEAATGILMVHSRNDKPYVSGTVTVSFIGSQESPSITINAKNNWFGQTESIRFQYLDSKWYQVVEKSKKGHVFIDQPAFTPIARSLQTCGTEAYESIKTYYQLDPKTPIVMHFDVYKLDSELFIWSYQNICF